MKYQYSRNIPSLSSEQWERLRAGRVCIAGCGGLGGYNAEYLARIGVGYIKVIDGDVFDETNLNRQLLSSRGLIGAGKAEAAKQRIAGIDAEICVDAVHAVLNGDNADELVADCDVVLDALDNVPSRLLLAEACGRQKLPLVHGAVQGWFAQTSVIMPGSGGMKKLYPSDFKGDKSCLSFTPAVCAAMQAAETVKLLCGMESELIGRLAMLDLRDMEMRIIDL